MKWTSVAASPPLPLETPNPPFVAHPSIPQAGIISFWLQSSIWFHIRQTVACVGTFMSACMVLAMHNALLHSRDRVTIEWWF